MVARHQTLEEQLIRYSQSLHNMQRQIMTLQQQLLEMTKTQFHKLAEAITEALKLPVDQACVLQDIVDAHLHQLAVTAQLQPPGGPFRMQPTHQQVNVRQEHITPPGQWQTNRDPRLDQNTAL